LTTHHKEN